MESETARIEDAAASTDPPSISFVIELRANAVDSKQSMGCFTAALSLRPNHRQRARSPLLQVAGVCYYAGW